ncbi:MAG: hypothetical protein HFE85_01260 [Clostridiales bacterium]|nr:hypothetical protein [Clostridiales bacterium]
MSLILCSADCQYQQDGCCGLNSPGTVTNLTHPGCVHYVPKQPRLDQKGPQTGKQAGPSY